MPLDEHLATINLDALPAWSFGDSPKMADELLALVLTGKKTATCTALDWHLADPLPPVGSLQVILDGQARPACVIQNTAQFIRRFCDVDDALTAKEGEGDLSLAYWQRAHQEFFTRMGVFDARMWLIFEHFRLVRVL